MPDRCSRLMSSGLGGDTARLLCAGWPSRLRYLGPERVSTDSDASTAPTDRDLATADWTRRPGCALERELEVPSNNLLVNLTPLIGRDVVVAEIKALLESAPLVTMSGMGGIGKTRTALQVAADMLQSDVDGVWFVDLAPLEDPALVPSAIAEALGVTEEGGQHQLMERITAFARAKRHFIVLDNCEHVIAAAADAASRLLRACPGVKILATSRELLGIDGEELYRMPALAVPPEHEPMTALRITEYGAAALFVARARTAQRGFALNDDDAGYLASIVRRLDGIAMAIELAASRVKVLSLQELDQRLDERLKLLSGGSRTAHPRQKTLRALIGWSYDLLSPAERSLLRQSAIFRAGWTLKAAAQVCQDDRFANWDVLDLLSSLVDKSLIATDGGADDRRYWLLESTRQFAAEQLDVAGEREDVAARHCRYFVQAAIEASDDYWRADSDSWMSRVRPDVENYRAAIDWGFSERGDATAAATIVASLRAFWLATSRHEGRRLLERAESLLDDRVAAGVRGLVALAMARLGFSSALTIEPTNDALRIFYGNADNVVRAEAAAFQGYALGRAGQVGASLEFFDQALSAARATRAPRLIGWVLSIAAYWVGASGDQGRAARLFDEAATLLRACNDRRALARLQSHHAEFLFASGDNERALACVREAERIYRERDDDADASGALLNAAAYLLACGRLGDAYDAAREGLRLVLRSFDDDYWVAIAIGHLAHLSAELGDLGRAARLLGYVDAVYRRVGSAREYTEARGYERTLELMRAKLPADQILALFAEGAQMEQDGAVDEAMAIAPPSSPASERSAAPTLNESPPAEDAPASGPTLDPESDGSRDRILRRVLDCGVPVIALLAPAGFGKSRIATAYAKRFRRWAVASPRRGMSAAEVLRSLHNDLTGNVDRAETSIDALCELLWHSDEQTCIVVDSMERLDNDVFLELLTALSRSRPDRGSLVLCSRREPPAFQFTDAIEPHLLAVFRRSDLELSIDQLRAMAPNDSRLSLAVLYSIYHLTRGWPVPSIALIAAVTRGAFERDALGLEHPALHELIDWVDKNVIAVLPEELQDVLLHCVACRDSTPSDFDAAYGDDPARADRRLYRNSQRADIGFAGEIRVHPLVAFAVRARRFSALEGCARENAALFLEHGKPLRAARALIGIADLAGAAAILDALDFEAARDVAGFPYPGLALEHHSRVKPAFERYPRLWLNLVPCRQYVVSTRTLAREGASVLREHAEDLETRLRRWITATVCALYVEAGDLESAQRYAAQLRNYEDVLDAEASIDTAEMYLDVAQGRYQSALERWQRVGPHFQSSPVWHALHLRCAVRAEVRLGSFQAGIDSLRALLSPLRLGGCPSLAGFGAMEAAFLSWYLGDTVAFRQYRKEFARIVQHYDVPRLWRGLCALFGEELDVSSAPAVEHHEVLAAIILADDEPDVDRGRILALRAIDIADRGDDAALKVVARIIAAARGVPKSEAFAAEAATMADAIDSAPLVESVAAFRGGARDIGYLQRHIDHIRKAAGTREPAESAPERITIEVATAEISRGGSAINVSEGTLQLAMLLAVSGDIGRDSIIDRMWPDLDGDAAANALKMCVHRARTHLGDASAIQVRKGMYALGPGVESTYRHILGCAAAATSTLSDSQRIEYTDVFDRLARGIASGRAPWPWFQPYGRALLDAMHGLGQRLAEDEIERGDPRVALQLARRMASVDPFDEGARILVVQAHVKLGNWTAAVHEFREFSDMLKRDLGTAPSERLRGLVEAS